MSETIPPGGPLEFRTRTRLSSVIGNRSFAALVVAMNVGLWWLMWWLHLPTTLLVGFALVAAAASFFRVSGRASPGDTVRGTTRAEGGFVTVSRSWDNKTLFRFPYDDAWCVVVGHWPGQERGWMPVWLQTWSRSPPIRLFTVRVDARHATAIINGARIERSRDTCSGFGLACELTRAFCNEVGIECDPPMT